MLLTKKGSGTAASSSPFVHSLRRGLSQALPTMDRRGFLRRSGLGVGVGLAATQLSLVKKAQASSGKPSGFGYGKVEVKRTICTHCSVGCAVDAVVENGVWVRQEPVFDSPINLGAHCAKGAALREHGHGEFRLRYPMKLINGKYERISWETAITEIATKLNHIRQNHAPRAIAFAGLGGQGNHSAGFGAIPLMYGIGTPMVFTALAQEKTQHWLNDRRMIRGTHDIYLVPDKHNAKFIKFAVKPCRFRARM